jgi:glycosyltransferase involved in cell wall biosynthesis
MAPVFDNSTARGRGALSDVSRDSTGPLAAPCARTRARRARARRHPRGDRGTARHGGRELLRGRGLAFTLVATERQRRELVAHKFGVELAQRLSSADVLVFPSRTDTFGLVMLESMACGTPVAAYPVTGPIDVVAPGVTGVLDDDLGKAALAALRLDRAACRRVACGKTWELASERFLSHLVRASDGSDL